MILVFAFGLLTGFVVAAAACAVIIIVAIDCAERELEAEDRHARSYLIGGRARS